MFPFALLEKREVKDQLLHKGQKRGICSTILTVRTEGMEMSGRVHSLDYNLETSGGGREDEYSGASLDKRLVAQKTHQMNGSG